MAERRRRSSRRQRILRFLGEVFLLGGISRGVSHSGDRSSGGDRLTARAALFDEGHRSYDDRPAGLLDAVPGWAVVVAFALLVVVVYLIR